MTEKLGKAASGTLGVLTAAMLTVSSVPAGYAADEKEQPTRTVMFYCMGGNLEESYGSAAGNLIQAIACFWTSFFACFVVIPSAVSSSLSARLARH